MATYVTTIELSEPLPHIELTNNVTGLLALARWHGRPVGVARLTNVANKVSPEQLRMAIEAQVQVDEKTVPITAKSPQRASVIICTRERPEDLRRCLEALLPLRVAGHEILVVDNAPSSTHTAEIVARYPFKYLCEPHIGLNNARNYGLHAATHPIVAYLDDDTVADSNWLTALLEPFTSPEVACVTGLVMPLELETPAQEQFEIYCHHRRDFVRRVFAAPQTQPAAAGVAGMGANMAFRRELLLHLGGFDSRLDGGTSTCSGGDTDMFARVLDTGTQIVYTPEALVWHRHRREQAELRRCIFGYGVGLFSFFTKRLIEARDLQALIIAARWLVGPLVKAAWRWLCGQPTVSLNLLLFEAGGACLGPLRFWQGRKHSQNLPGSILNLNPEKL